jgi:hypothetical protein
MSRYVTLAKPPRASQVVEQAQPLPHPTVHDLDPIKTGILDKDGHDIYRLPDAIGFIRSRS